MWSFCKTKKEAGAWGVGGVGDGGGEEDELF